MGPFTAWRGGRKEGAKGARFGFSRSYPVAVRGDRPGRSFVIERVARARCSLERVAELLSSPSTWPQWQGEIVSVERDGRVSRGDVVRGRARMLGFTVWGHSEITGDPPAFAEDVVVGVRMRVTYELEDNGGATTVIHRLRAELPGGPLGRLLSLFLRRRLRRMQAETLAALTAQAEGDSSSIATM